MKSRAFQFHPCQAARCRDFLLGILVVSFMDNFSVPISVLGPGVGKFDDFLLALL